MPMNRARPGRNRVLVVEAEQALESFKEEIANELGIPNYTGIDRGELTSRQNGYVGGTMVRKMIQQIETQLAGGQLQPSSLVQQPIPKQPQEQTQVTQPHGTQLL